MYIDDFIKEVKELSTKYDVEVTDGQVDVYYSRRKHAKYPKYHQVLTVPLQAQYTFSRRVGLDDFEALPFSHKLYMLGAELAKLHWMSVLLSLTREHSKIKKSIVLCRKLSMPKERLG